MISGITICHDALGQGYPVDLSLSCWSSVCDEIVVMTCKDDPSLQHMMNLVEGEKRDCAMKLRAIEGPKFFELFRMFGYFFTTTPDWVVHFDLDYLISPKEARELRRAILCALPTTEMVTYKLVHLNRGATRMVFNPDMKTWLTPFDGVRAEYPFIVNPRRQMMSCPFCGVTEDNFFINYEGVISLNREHWGKGLFPKMLVDKKDPYEVNPFNFEIVRSGAQVEHLSFSGSEENLKRKLEHPYWKNLGMDYRYVVEGQMDYPVSYPGLETARERYKSPNKE
jgi:hypothetical protein